MFERIMNNPVRIIIVTYLAKEYIAYHKHVILEAKRWTDQEGYLGDRDDDQGHDAVARSSMLIFSGP
jgi:hypothetical protein